MPSASSFLESTIHRMEASGLPICGDATSTPCEPLWKKTSLLLSPSAATAQEACLPSSGSESRADCSMCCSLPSVLGSELESCAMDGHWKEHTESPAPADGWSSAARGNPSI